MIGIRTIEGTDASQTLNHPKLGTSIVSYKRNAHLPLLAEDVMKN